MLMPIYSLSERLLNIIGNRLENPTMRKMFCVRSAVYLDSARSRQMRRKLFNRLELLGCRGANSH